MKKFVNMNGLDRYDTPDDAPKSRLFPLMLKSRLYFYAVDFGIFCRSGYLGARGKLDKEAQIRLSGGNITLLESCGCKVHVIGRENLRALNGRSVLMMGNHMSLLETGMLHAAAREYVDFAYVIKESLLKVPYFKGIFDAIGHIAVTRKNPREDLKTVLTKGKEILQNGKSLVVFPQSTRTAQFRPEHFNSIGIKIARAAGVPVVPFAVKTDVVSQGKILRDMGPIHPERQVWFEFAPAMEITGNGQEQLQWTTDFIQSRLKQWFAAENREDEL